jgi:hypothetical protein
MYGVMSKKNEMTRILPIFIIGFLISMILVVGSFEVDVYSQNVGNETSAATTQQSTDNGGASLLKDLIIDHAGGGFTSLQTDADNTTWIATGKWDLVSDPSKIGQSNSSSTHFNTTIHTRNTDNSQGHDHKISDFNLVNSSINSSSKGSIILLNGTATIDTDVGVYHDVPISIRIVDAAPAILSIGTQSNEVKPQWVPRGGTIALLIDQRVQDHFGNTPVYGDIRKEK